MRDLPAAAEVTFSIHDLNGRIVYQEKPGATTKGLHQFPLDTGAWQNGVYVVKARIGDRLTRFRFVVHR